MINYKEKFNPNNYVGKYVMHCPTEAHAKSFGKHLDKFEMSWATTQTSRNYINYNPWQSYRSYTCYNFNKGTFADVNFYAKNGYTILEWDHFGRSIFNKADLLPGMIAECANGVRYLVLNDTMVSNNDNASLGDYSDDLVRVDGKYYLDIVRVFTMCQSFAIDTIFSDDNLMCIYDKQEDAVDDAV